MSEPGILLFSSWLLGEKETPAFPRLAKTLYQRETDACSVDRLEEDQVERGLSLLARRELIAHQRQAYREADLPTKNTVLDEICALTGYHRASAPNAETGKALVVHS